MLDDRRYLASVSDIPAGLIEALRDPEPMTRCSAILALGRHGGEDALHRLLMLRHDPSSWVRALLCDVIPRLTVAKWGPPHAVFTAVQLHTAVPFLVELLADHDPDVRSAAARGLSAMHGPETVGRLVALACGPVPLVLLADDPDVDVRAGVAAVLGTQPGPDTIDALGILARDEATPVRAELVSALGRSGRPEAVPLVIALAADPDPGVRTRAAVAAGRMGGAAMLETLRRLAEDAHPRVRSTAATVLARQPEAPPK
jgi:HEAT repeat protein